MTSRRDDGTWTWRAAGARHPKGEVADDLVPEAAAVGSVLRAEVDGGLDGLEITALAAPRVRSEPTGRLELIGGGGGPLVTTALVSRAGRRGHADRDVGDGDERSHAKPRRGRDQGDRRKDRDQRGRADRGPRPRERDGDDGRRERSQDKSDRRQRDGRRPPRGRGPGPRPDAEPGTKDRSRGERRGAEDRPQTKSRSKDTRSKDTRSKDTRNKDTRNKDTRSKDTKRAGRAPRPRTPGLKAKRVHRQAALAALPEDQRPLAREVLKGGVPAVRRSVERMNAKAAQENLPPIKSEPVLALAEQLAPDLKAAEWHDRADAALAGIAKIDLRDLRSVIAAADRAARNDETRTLAENLRAGLVQRLEVDHRKWLDELAGTIAAGRTVRALRLSSRPVKPGSPLPPDMAERLAGMTAADLNPTASQQRWATVVDSVALSPVRTQVVPAGIPDRPTDELLAAIRRLADRVPQIAALFGVEPAPAAKPRLRPPPPPPEPAARPTEEPQANTENTAEPGEEPQADTENTAEPAEELPASAEDAQ